MSVNVKAYVPMVYIDDFGFFGYDSKLFPALMPQEQKQKIDRNAKTANTYGRTINIFCTHYEVAEKLLSIIFTPITRLEILNSQRSRVSACWKCMSHGEFEDRQLWKIYWRSQPLRGLRGDVVYVHLNDFSEDFITEVELGHKQLFYF